MCRFVLSFFKKLPFLLLLYCTLHASPGDVITSVATPGRTPTGLAFDGERLWVADRLSDTLYAVDPASGEVVRTLPAPGFIPRGLAWDGEYLWCVDGEEKRILQVDVNNGITLRSLEAPTPSPHGLAWDGEYLWLSDPREDVLCRISTEDGTTIVRHKAPSTYPTGLTYWNGYLWCADRRDDKLYLFDPEHGEVVFAVNAPGKHARGLATDGKVLWNADYQDDAVFTLVIDDGEAVKLTNPHTLDLLLTHEFRNYGPGEVLTLDVYVAVPDDLPGQKLVREQVFNPQPLEILLDRWQQPVAHFHFTDLPLAARQQVTMEVTAELSDLYQLVYPHKVGTLEDIPKDIRKAYLVDEDKYRINDPIIQNAVAAAVGGETNPYWMMRRIHKYVCEHLYYEMSGGWNVAPRVLERGNGSCSEYTFVFISMCRAAGIPARYVGTLVVRGDDASADETFHRWSQVYLPGCGWVHVDPQGGDEEKPADVAASIGEVGNRFLITTVGGGASEYLGWNYNCNQKWTSRGPVKIHTEAVGEWSPTVEAEGE